MSSPLIEVRADVRSQSRFWALVQQGDLDECWPWLGATARGGYGMFSVNTRLAKGVWKTSSALAHRLSVMFDGREIPDGLETSHLCHNPRCVNPAHIVVESHLENMRRGQPHRTLPTHCPQGHPYEGDNLYVTPRTGFRQCKECRRVNLRRSRQRRSSQ